MTVTRRMSKPLITRSLTAFLTLKTFLGKKKSFLRHYKGPKTCLSLSTSNLSHKNDGLGSLVLYFSYINMVDLWDTFPNFDHYIYFSFFELLLFIPKFDHFQCFKKSHGPG